MDDNIRVTPCLRRWTALKCLQTSLRMMVTIHGGSFCSCLLLLVCLLLGMEEERSNRDGPWHRQDQDKVGACSRVVLRL